MHCNSIFKTGALFIVVSMLVVTACHRTSPNNLSEEDDNGGYASDASRIEWVNDDVISMADAAASVYNGHFMGQLVTVGTDTTHDPHVLTIRFGDVDYLCLDGRKRGGTINVFYSGLYTDPAKVHTIIYDKYFINDNQLTGSVKTIRVDTTVLGNWYYSVLVNDSLNMSLDPLNSKYVIWQGALVRKWAQGFVTGTDRSDDIFSVSGSATLTRPNGHQFTCEISSPLQFAMNCDFCEAGVIDVTGYTPPMRVLNYGFGTCDAIAQLNISTNVYTINLTK